MAGASSLTGAAISSSVDADVPPIEVLVVEEHDAYVGPLGAKGPGELGIGGAAAAIAHAVCDAVGKAPARTAVDARLGLTRRASLCAACKDYQATAIFQASSAGSPGLCPPRAAG